MSAPMRKPHTRRRNQTISMRHAGVSYCFPIEIADRYRIKKAVLASAKNMLADIDKQRKNVNSESVFANIDKKYTKPGALLRGIRVRENLTQAMLARKIKVTQSDVSQMENGVRTIGRKVAQRIEKLFGVNYRSFLT